MNELSPRLKSVIKAITQAGQQLPPEQQDEVTDAILDLGSIGDLSPEVVKPLIAEADTAIARGEVFAGEQVMKELQARLDALPH